MYNPRSVLSVLPLVAVFCIGAVVLFSPFANDGNPALAESEANVLFLSVTGEGPTAKAWYDEAPPAGVALQDALDKFAAEGYRVVKVVEPHVSTTGGFTWSILMERASK